MAMRTTQGADAIYGATMTWRSRCLSNGRSLFAPEQPGWTAELFDELERHVVRHRGTGSESLIQTLEGQLSEASPAAVQLAAELLYVHFLLTVRVVGTKKREAVMTALSWMPKPTRIDPQLDRAFDHGLVRPGTFYSRRRDVALAFLIRFGQTWSGMDHPARAGLLEDPWAFKALVWSVPVRTAFTQRNALLHLVHPDTFEVVVSDEQKRMIGDRLGHSTSDPTIDIDRRLLEVRAALDPSGSGRLDFYSGDLKALWCETTR